LNAMYNICHDVPGGKLKINDTKTKYVLSIVRRERRALDAIDTWP